MNNDLLSRGLLISQIRQQNAADDKKIKMLQMYYCTFGQNWIHLSIIYNQTKTSTPSRGAGWIRKGKKVNQQKEK